MNDNLVNRIEDCKLNHLLLLEDTEDFQAGCLLTARNTEIAEWIISECAYNKDMHQRGIRRASTLLLGGESGSGKTLMVQCIAHQLGLPLATVRYGGLLNRPVQEVLLGITEIFDAIRDYPCVLCFDDIDAFFAMQQYRTVDREYDMVIYALKQELNHFSSHSVFVATASDVAVGGGSQYFDPTSIPFELTEQTELLSSIEDIHKVGSAYFELAGDEVKGNWEEFFLKCEASDDLMVPMYKLINTCAGGLKSERWIRRENAL